MFDKNGGTILRRLLYLYLLVSVACFGAPFTVTSTTDAMALVNSLLGSGVTVVGTPVLTGVTGQAGLFSAFDSGPWVNPITNASGQVTMPKGIILSSGYATNAVGTYNGGASDGLGGGGDSDLTALSGYSTYDAATLTFSFTTNAPTLYFNYIFASTEYPNYVNSQYNDAFGFFLDGTNIALIPGTTTPVTVNSVNVGKPVGVSATNPQYFTQYSVNGVTPFNYGGITTVFTISELVDPTAVHTISLKIGDASDSVLDSAVLIQGGTFGTVNPVPEPATFVLMGGALIAVAGLRRLVRRG